ncbi:MAG: alpha/beta hydrolase fold domain-containing protein, partial [Anaerolineae bacterium]|nr:alpha/beta hydrolase fold domain-containing protein [Anaerolineae bacterium]
MKTRRLLISIYAFVVLGSAVPASAQPRRLFADGSNVFYGAEGDRNRMVDVFLPVDVEPPYPVVLMFNGRNGDKSDHVRSGLPQLMVDEGYAAVAVRYNSALPQAYATELPQAYADALCALAWTYTQGAADWGFDPERVALYGASLGGLVSAWMAAVDEP